MCINIVCLVMFVPSLFVDAKGQTRLFSKVPQPQVLIAIFGNIAILYKEKNDIWDLRIDSL